MALRFAFPLAILSLALLGADFPAAAQIGSPYPTGGVGGYPGGPGYPGGAGGTGLPLPGRRSRNSSQATDQLGGKIQRLSTSQLVLDPGDGRNIVVALDRNTKYFLADNGPARFGDFDAGDEVNVDASRDNQNFYHGLRVTMVKKGQPTEVTSSKPGDSRGSDDPDKPVLKRAGNTASPSDDDPDRPRLKRAGSDSAASASTPRAQITQPDDDQAPPPARAASNTQPKPAPREADDPGPPVLRRGSVRIDKTPPAGSEVETASTRPSIKADDVNGVTRLPEPLIVAAPSSETDSPVSAARAAMQGPPSGDPVIQSAREAAASFSESLPNYIVKQFTTRYQTDTAKGNRTAWQALDVVSADVVSESGKDTYRNLLVNGKPPKDAIEKTGSWSTGEFSIIQLNLLAPQTDADFHNKRSTTIVNRAAYKYDYSVEQPNSNWDVHASAESYKPGYTGTIWIDKENFRVLRIEMSAKNMPKAFPLDTVESALDYDYVLIGDQKFLLPSHSEALSCIRGTAECSRNVIEFRNYRKFGSDTSIKFETDK